MKLSITSSSGVILSADSFVRVTIMTEDGEVTILTGHEPLLSAVRPGILYTEYHIGNKVHTAEYATGGGVLNISPESCTIVADVVESDDKLSEARSREDDDSISSREWCSGRSKKTHRTRIRASQVHCHASSRTEVP